MMGVQWGCGGGPGSQGLTGGHKGDEGDLSGERGRTAEVSGVLKGNGDCRAPGGGCSGVRMTWRGSGDTGGITETVIAERPWRH